ncbi:MAG: hypothetical protein R6V45_02880 [Oceanipulchritudo sp.]
MIPTCTTLPYFPEELHLDQLESFLTLFTSTFPDLGMVFPGWKVETGERVPARPALIFREVDGEGTLHFRLAEAVGQLPDQLFGKGSFFLETVLPSSSLPRRRSQPSA